MAIYQGADTMKATRAQSLWDVLQGKKRHEKETLEQLGKRNLFGSISDIGESFLPPGWKQLFDVGSKQLEQELFKLPVYQEEGSSFWGGSEIAELKEQDVALRKGADESLLESIIGQIEGFVGDSNSEGGFDLSSLFGGGGGSGGGGYREIEDYNDLPKGLPFFDANTGRVGTNLWGGGTSYPTVTGDFSDIEMDWREGGQVPKYYGGGSVSGDSPPTIAGYFSQQGKTLGGSNTQSLAEKLGRK